LARPKQVIRADGTKWCDWHLAWEPLDRFNAKTAAVSGNACVTRYAARCLDAQQAIRDRDRATDPAADAIVNRARKHARALSKALGVTVSYHWVLDELLWIGLVPFLRAAIGPGGVCLNCGAHHDKAAEYQIEHAVTPRSLTDWAAHHARNLWFADGCNQKKGTRDRDRAWIDTQQMTWALERDWALHAGEPGWPPYDSTFGEVPEVIYATGPVDWRGNPMLFESE
jgi:hypothetical protein